MKTIAPENGGHRLASIAASKHCTALWCHPVGELDRYGVAVVQQRNYYAVP